MFVDCLCIPRDARHKRNAERLINFLLRPDVAARNMAALLYPMPNPERRKLLPADIAPIVAPLFEIDQDKLQFIGELGGLNKALDRAWTELRSE
jgi:spermidine/putrescine-binding protein